LTEIIYYCRVCTKDMVKNMTMKKKKTDNMLPVDGLLKSEAIAKLQREGYDVSFEQLRKYEAPGLVRPYKKPGSKYRIYQPETLERIRWICRLRLIRFSLTRIKHFFNLRNEILESNLICSREVGKDLDTRESIIIREMPPAEAVDEIKYERLRVKIDEYNTICDEIKEKAGKVVAIMAYTKEEVHRDQKEVKEMTEVSE